MTNHNRGNTPEFGVSVAVPPLHGRPTVLVVDDVAATRSGIAQLLELRGYATRCAEDGAAALQLLRDDAHVRLVILDLAMPTRDGYWFREQQLQDAALADVPVVVFTGMPADVVVRALAGVDVLSKPLAIDRLLEIVEKHCGVVEP